MNVIMIVEAIRCSLQSFRHSAKGWFIALTAQLTELKVAVDRLRNLPQQVDDLTIRQEFANKQLNIISDQLSAFAAELQTIIAAVTLS